MSAMTGTILLVVIFLALAVAGAWDTTKTRQRGHEANKSQEDRT